MSNKVLQKYLLLKNCFSPQLPNSAFRRIRYMFAQFILALVFVFEPFEHNKSIWISRKVWKRVMLANWESVKYFFFFFGLAVAVCVIEFSSWKELPFSDFTALAKDFSSEITWRFQIIIATKLNHFARYLQFVVSLGNKAIPFRETPKAILCRKTLHCTPSEKKESTFP